MSGDYLLVKYDLAVHRQRNEHVPEDVPVKPTIEYAGMTRQQRALATRKKMRLRPKKPH